jgi:hypothetical protein
VAVAEISKRSSFLGGLLASLPLVSFLALIWLYLDTKDTAKVAWLSTSIFWLVLPSLAFFVALPPLLKLKMNFYASLGLATAFMLAGYGVMLVVLKKFGVNL